MQQQHKQLLKKHGKSFYWAGVFLGESQLDAAKRLYGFCRYIDDIVDETHDKNKARDHIDQIKQQIELGTSHDPIVQDLLIFIEEYQVDPKIVLDLIAGVSWDLDHHKVVTEEELLCYAYRVAGTVGLLMCAIFGVRKSQACAYAVDLGLAMQLTNIARDIKEDAVRGRVYLPQSWFANGLSADDILSGDCNKVIYTQLLKLLDLADRYYRSADYGMAYLPRRARLSILIASRLYEEIGIKCGKLGHVAYWQTVRVATKKSEKIALSLKALGQFLLQTKYRKTLKQHDTDLHLPLKNLFTNCNYV